MTKGNWKDLINERGGEGYHLNLSDNHYIRLYKINDYYKCKLFSKIDDIYEIIYTANFRSSSIDDAKLISLTLVTNFLINQISFYKNIKECITPLLGEEESVDYKIPVE